jgi:fatty acid desaturase
MSNDTQQAQLNSDEQRIERIRAVIRQNGDEWRERFPLLKNNNAIGFTIFSVSCIGVILAGYAYLQNQLSALSCIVIVALLTSLLHELEHDLIHWRYFKNNKAMHHLMMLGVWMFRPGTINPWIRRRLHFLHHKTSGTEADLEERGIGNGMPYTPMRWWIMHDTVMGNIAKILMSKGQRKPFRVMRLILAYFPFGVLTVLLWYCFLAIHGAEAVCSLAGLKLIWPEWLQAFIQVLNPAVVILIAPHYLRSFCLIFISSNMHYFGNVDSVLKQTQVLNAWYFWPFQLFCFNFGSTHAIHHFVVSEPFYIRQLTAKAAHKVMREQGVPFNDIASIRQANRYPQQELA